MTRARDVADRAVITTADLVNIPSGAKNLIINGDMRIDQRNAGSSVSVANTGVYTVDRWRASNGTSTATVQQSSTAPTGFSNSLLWTVSTTDNTTNQSHSLQHKIEGYNTAPLNLGTANAETVTLSFWVRSSLTGTYGIGINNSAENRSYVATYTISSADTWEQKTITFTNDTSGTWVGSTNGIGILINFDLGSGSDYNGTADTWQSGNYRRTSGCVNLANTSGATFYITGVQLEVGDTATPFEHRPYDMELARCQRYYEKAGWKKESVPGSTPSYAGALAAATMGNNTFATPGFRWNVIKRTRPSVTVYGSILDAIETAGIIVDWNFGTSCGTATIYRVEDCGYNYISAPTATSHGHIYRIVADAEL